MEAAPFDNPPHGFLPFDIYNDGTAVVPQPQPNALPTGFCHYVDVTSGGNGAKCGCRRFWVRQTPGSPILDQPGWCMCNHHACYHDHSDSNAQQFLVNDYMQRLVQPEQENERPRNGREPLSPVPGLSFGMPLLVTNPEAAAVGFEGASRILPQSPAPHDISPHSTALVPGPASMPDTLPWDDGHQSERMDNALPPIPSQCLLNSQTASSTTSSVRAKLLRPFGGKGLDTLNHVKGQSPLRLQYGVRSPNPQSPYGTLAATSVRHAQPDEQARSQASPGFPLSHMNEVLRSPSHGALKELNDIVGSHGQRLDRLENVSFSTAGHDECHEKHDQMDLRMTDLESRMEDLEKQHGDNSTVRGARSEAGDETASHSFLSVSTGATTRTAQTQEMYTQIQSLHNQVKQLQSYMPSMTRPWEIEVVFLPFRLNRVWQHIEAFKGQDEPDEWTQLPMTHNANAQRPETADLDDWTDPSIEADWLLPRACSETNLVTRRLKSRGLVKKILIRGSSARDVQRAVDKEFSGVFRALGLLSVDRSDADPRFAQYLGLASAWVPLRKIHKESRLRLLSPAEMISPVMWDVPFLHNVIMRGSEPKLFITQPEAYRQDRVASRAAISWKDVREMDRVYPDVTESRGVPEADALEEAWEWDSNLDMPSAYRTTKSRPSAMPMLTSPSSRFALFRQGSRSSSPIASRTDRRDLRPPHLRTTSLPMKAFTTHTPTTARRRIVSSGQSRRSSPSVRVIPQPIITKRRHTRSPSRARYTPRWTASPTPGPLSAQERQAARGPTPSAYATPHSYGPLQDLQPIRQGSVSRRVVSPDYGVLVGHNEDNYFRGQRGNGNLTSESGISHDDMAHDDEDDMTDEEGEERCYVDLEQEIADYEQVAAAQSSHGQHLRWHLEADEPWPGIETDEPMSCAEGMDESHTDAATDVSSQPSEYSSKEHVWPQTNGDFLIHEDNE